MTQAKLTDREIANLATAYREAVDKLYAIAEWSKLGDDWVYETAQTIRTEIEQKTGLNMDEY